jgi:D-aminopeptidase
MAVTPVWTESPATTVACPTSTPATSVIAFSTAEQVRRRTSTAPRDPTSPPAARALHELANDDMSALFEAVIEATEEAIYTSMFMATTVTSRGRTVDAIPLDSVRAVLRKYGIGRR